jgi:hypothetical protein
MTALHAPEVNLGVIKLYPTAPLRITHVITHLTQRNDKLEFAWGRQCFGMKCRPLGTVTL